MDLASQRGFLEGALEDENLWERKEAEQGGMMVMWGVSH